MSDNRLSEEQLREIENITYKTYLKMGHTPEEARKRVEERRADYERGYKLISKRQEHEVEVNIGDTLAKLNKSDEEIDNYLKERVKDKYRLLTNYDGTNVAVPVKSKINKSSYVGESATVFPGVEVGPYARIGARGTRGHVVLMENAKVGADSQLNGHVYVYPNVKIGANVTIEGSPMEPTIIEEGAQVADGARIGSGSIIRASGESNINPVLSSNTPRTEPNHTLRNMVSGNDPFSGTPRGQAQTQTRS